MPTAHTTKNAAHPNETNSVGNDVDEFLDVGALVIGCFDGSSEVGPNPNPNTGEEDGNFECRTEGTLEASADGSSDVWFVGRSEGDVLGYAATDGVELEASADGSRSEGDVLGYADTDGVEP